MSGTASVPTQFQAAVTATGLQLDNNFNTIVGYLNDPTNRVNYATDGGSTNTLVINPSPAVVGGYSAGLTITFRAAFTNNGAVVANVSGIGNSSVLDQQQRQLTVSAIIAGSVYQMAYNGTSAFTLLSPNSVVANQPALTSLTSGAGTYTVSAGAVRLSIQMIGGGGGGAGNVGGSAGGDSKFGTLLAGGGVGGGTTGGGGGGTATGAAINITGGPGGFLGIAFIGGPGGNGAFGGGAGSTTSSVGLTAGINSGGGGGGGANPGAGGSGGGGSGGFVQHNFVSPASTYTYTVGAGGAAGGNSGYFGNTGAAGIIIIETFFS